MKSPLILRFGNLRRQRLVRDPRHGERGITMALVAIAMVAIIAMAALSIDMVTLYLAREEAQRAADTAALTAAKIISVSGITGTASMSDTTQWQSICGTTGVATYAAQTAGGQNAVGMIAGNVSVNYSAGNSTNTPVSDCSTLGAVFAINPVVTVQVTRPSLPTFFSRAWGITGNTISATAVAEAFNSSASENAGTSGEVIPVLPRCIKPWMVPNLDPRHPLDCTGGACNSFVSLTDGTITNPGISLNGSGTNGVIGESFNLFADCQAGTSCAPHDNPPTTNIHGFQRNYEGNRAPNRPNLEYLPGQVQSGAVAVPGCGTAGTGTNPDYEPAVAGCDQTTQYQCGGLNSAAGTQNYVDLTENPGGANGDTSNGLACTLTGQSSVPLAGQDVLNTTAYPFQITAGAANLLKIPSGTQITMSNQIVSLPIYDNTQIAQFNGTNPIPVTIVGFLQVFINSIDDDGNISITVLNVAGCGNGNNRVTIGAPVNGWSPVPVRLITPP
jgi:Flp pilus assembly protein TadG